MLDLTRHSTSENLIHGGFTLHYSILARPVISLLIYCSSSWASAGPSPWVAIRGRTQPTGTLQTRFWPTGERRILFHRRFGSKTHKENLRTLANFFSRYCFYRVRREGDSAIKVWTGFPQGSKASTSFSGEDSPKADAFWWSGAQAQARQHLLYSTSIMERCLARLGSTSL